VYKGVVQALGEKVLLPRIAVGQNDIGDYSVSDECGGVRGSGGKSKGEEQGQEMKGGENKRKEKKKLGVEKRKWGKRGLSILIFEQNGRGR
jgi:hypothetical protein